MSTTTVKSEKTLYKKDSKGKIRQWTIICEGNSYWTVTGVHEGKLITNKPIYASAKNVGKANETTPEYQAVLEVEAIVKKKKEKGYYESIEDAGKGAQFFIPQTGKVYKEHKHKLDKRKRVSSQRKLDGIRSTIQAIDRKNPLSSEVAATSREGKDQPVIKHILSEAETILSYYNIVLDGELYNHDLRDDFNEISSIVKKQYPTKKCEKKAQEWEEAVQKAEEFIQYHVYDCFVIDKPDMPFLERFELLKEIFDGFNLDYLKLVETTEVHTNAEIDRLYDLYLEEEYEGQIIRSNVPYLNKKTDHLLKRKEFYDSEYKILSFQAGTGNRTGMAGAVFIEIPSLGESRKTNIKGPRKWLKKLWDNQEEYIGKMGTVRYPNLTPDGVPRFGQLIAVRDYE